MVLHYRAFGNRAQEIERMDYLVQQNDSDFPHSKEKATQYWDRTCNFVIYFRELDILSVRIARSLIKLSSRYLEEISRKTWMTTLDSSVLSVKHEGSVIVISFQHAGYLTTFENIWLNLYCIFVGVLALVECQ